MLSVYTRHYAPCKHTDIYHRRFRCPKWIEGTLDDGRVIRQSSNTRDWEKAGLTARDLEDAANPLKPEARTRVTIADAIQCFAMMKNYAIKSCGILVRDQFWENQNSAIPTIQNPAKTQTFLKFCLAMSRF